MVVFENDKYLNDIRKNGISATDSYAEKKIRDLISDLVNNSEYRKNKVLSIVKNIAKDYFYGLPESLIDIELNRLYSNAKSKDSTQKANESKNNRVVTLYESEMQTIASIKDENLMKLAFASLVLHKFNNQFVVDGEIRHFDHVKHCKADAYHIAGLDSLSGAAKDKMWKQLSDLELVKSTVIDNPAWQYRPDWIAMTRFAVPYNIDPLEDKSKEKVYKQITNYDDVLLYLRYWLKDKNLIECADCGCPIVKTSSTKCLCSNCASARKKASDNARYRQKTA